MDWSANIEAVRRRATARAARAVFRATNARLRQPGGLSGAAIRSILICRPNHRLGNLLLLTPLIHELARVFPDAKVDLVVAGDDADELFGAFTNVRRIYRLSRRVVRHPLATARVAWQIRRARYDLAIDPCEASQSSRVLLVLANAKRALGLPRDLAIGAPDAPRTRLCAPPHMAQWPVYLLRRALTRCPRDGDYPALDIRLSSTERVRARKALDGMLRSHDQAQATSIIGVFAEATGAKRYPRDWWYRFIVEVRASRPDCAFVEILPPDGRPRLAMDLPTFSAHSPRKIAAMVSNMTCFVSADCGVMHLASASGTPTIGLFSVTDVSKYRPYGYGDLAVVTNGKSPEAIARLVSAHVASLAAGTTGDPGRWPPRSGAAHPADACLAATAAGVSKTWPRA